MNLNKFYINGEWVDPVTPKTLEVENPATEENFAVISLGSQADVDKAVAAAKAAFQAFSKQNGVEDLSSLEKASDTISDHMDALADIDSIMAESGKLPLAFDDDDDDDLLKELEQYEMQDESNGNARQPDYSSMAQLPEAPKGAPAQPEGVELTVEQTLEQPVVLEMNVV